MQLGSQKMFFEEEKMHLRFFVKKKEKKTKTKQEKQTSPLFLAGDFHSQLRHRRSSPSRPIPNHIPKPRGRRGDQSSSGSGH